MLKRPNDLDDLGGTPMTRGNLPSRQRNGHDCQTALRPSRDAECTTDQAVLAGSRSSGAAESSRNKVVSPKWQWEIPKTMGFNTQNGLMTWMLWGTPILGTSQMAYQWLKWEDQEQHIIEGDFPENHV